MARITALEQENALLKAENASLKAEVASLKAQLNQHSGNSHRPPSSDGYRKSSRLPKTKKKRGGQRGHKGSTLQMVSVADHVEKLLPCHCSCGADLQGVASELVERRQVFDLPDPKLEVTEYQRYRCQCPSCGMSCQEDFPSSVVAPVQYGPGVQALVVLLNNSFNLPFGKIQQLFVDLFGYKINENTLCQANARAYESLASSESLIREHLSQQGVVHADETGLRVEGKLQWLHTVCAERFTYLFVHPKRGKKALESEASLLPRLSNWVIHDCWASYFKFDQARHALCGAHLLRELYAQIEQKRQWAQQMFDFLIELYRKTDSGTKALTHQQTIRKRFQRICYHADLEEPPPQPRKRGRPKKSKGRNLLERLQKHQEAVLAFAFHPEVPFTNNLAERDIRPIKVKQKVSGTFRSSKGAKYYARIQAFVSTARKQQRNTFKELKYACNGNTFLTRPEMT